MRAKRMKEVTVEWRRITKHRTTVTIDPSYQDTDSAVEEALDQSPEYTFVGEIGETNIKVVEVEDVGPEYEPGD